MALSEDDTPYLLILVHDCNYTHKVLLQQQVNLPTVCAKLICTGPELSSKRHKKHPAREPGSVRSSASPMPHELRAAGQKPGIGAAAMFASTNAQTSLRHLLTLKVR